MIRNFFQVRAGEERIVLLLGTYTFLMLAGTTLLGAAADAFFLKHLESSKLAIGILLGQLVTIPAFSIYGLARKTVSARWLNPLLATTMVTILLALYLVAERKPEVIAFAFIALAPCFAGILGSENGRLSASMVDSRSARRLFPLIGTVGGMGAAVGGLLVSFLSERIGLAAMFALAAVFIAAVTIPTWFIRESVRPRILRMPANRGAVLRNRYGLILVLSAGVLAAISTLVRFQFGSAAAERFVGDEIGAYYGNFAAAINLTSIIFTLFIARFLMQKIGAGTALLLYPLLVGAVATIGIFFANLATATATIFTDRLVRQNIHRTVSTVAIMPVHGSIRARAALMKSGLIRPLAVVITSLAIIVLTGDLSRDAWRIEWGDLFWGVLALTLLMLFAMAYVRKQYLLQILNALHARRLQLDDSPADAVVMDGPLKGLLLKHLSSDLPERSSLALQLFRGFVDTEVVDVIERRWPDWEPWLRAEAVDLLKDESVPASDQFISSLSGEQSDEIQAAQICLRGGELDDDTLRQTIDTAPPVTRAQAAVALARRHGPDAISELVQQWVESDDPDDSRAAAIVMQDDAVADLDIPLERLIETAPIPTLRVIRKRLQPRYAQLCTRWLANDKTFVEARAALQALGPAAIEALEAAAVDPHAGPGALQILAAMDDDRAQDAMLRLLTSPDSDTRVRAATARAHVDRPLDSVQREQIRKNLAAAQERVERFDAHARNNTGLLGELASGERRFSLEHVFLYLKLLYPRTPFRQLFLASQSFDKKQRALAAEAIDVALPATLKGQLLPILEGEGKGRPDADDPEWQSLVQHIGSGKDEGSNALAALGASGLFPGWRLPELEQLLDRPAQPGEAAIVIRDGRPLEPEKVVLAGKTPETMDSDIVVPLKSIYQAIATNARCGGLWLQGLASRVPVDEAAAAEVTRSEMLSLATRTLATDQDAADDIDLWQRVFFLRTMALTQALPSHRLRLLAEIAETVTAESGETVVNEGRLGHHFYLVCTGKLDVRSRGQQLATLGPSDAFGAMALMRGERRMTTVTALERTELLTIDRVDFLDLVDAHPALVRSFSRMLASQIIAASSPVDTAEQST